MSRPPAIALAVILAALGGWLVGRLQAEAALAARPHAVPAGTLADAETAAPGFRAVAPVTADTRAVAGAREEVPVHDRDPAGVVAVLRGGSDSERLEALNTALASDIELQPEVLIDIYENAGSEELRLLAFGTHIDSLAIDVETARTAMRSATVNSNLAVRAEAYRRLDQLAAYEAALADAATLVTR